MTGVLPRLHRWACCVSTRGFCSVLVALVGPEQSIFSKPDTISIILSPSARQGQAVVLGGQFRSMCV
jgi:hypothetical protein